MNPIGRTRVGQGRCRWLTRLTRRAGCPARQGALFINGILYALDEVLDKDQRQVGWDLHKINDKGKRVTTYNVDTTFGPSPEHWTCSCPDARYCRNIAVSPVRTCKHVRALHAALAHDQPPQPPTVPAMPALACRLLSLRAA